MSQRGVVVDMSFNHRSTYELEHGRIKDLQGYFEDGYLNESLQSHSPFTGSSSPLISDPKIHQIILTEDDDILILACDSIWDVLSSQNALSNVTQRLRHVDPRKYGI
ncbi:hypothetical protein N665_0936s0002 [Sinapis alba]|nr:hypothetical protein N665_0936s0002 [Sinapis alba]